MPQVRSTCPVPSRAYCRAGFLSRGLLIALAVVLTVPVIGWSVLANWRWSSQEDDDVMMVAVEEKEFIHDITERGNVESAKNVEIRSKVKSSSGGGSGSTTILEIVEEGTVINPDDCLPEGAVITYEELKRYEELKERQKGEFKTREKLGRNTSSPGKTEPKPNGDGSAETGGKPDHGESGGTKRQRREGKRKRFEIKAEDLLDKMVLVKLDSSSLENKKIEQEIVVHTSKADLIRVQNTLDTARIEREEYLDGTYGETKQGMEGQISGAKGEISGAKAKITKAEEALTRAREYRDYSERLYAKGYISERELEANEFDVTARGLDLEMAQTNLEIAETNLEMAQTRLRVLTQYTRKKDAGELDAKIATAEANLKAEKARHKLKEDRLEEVEEQFADCTIFATQPGQVVYANDPGHHGRGAIVIEEGTPIREHQVIIRLPDPSQMQVKAKISEGKISLVKAGMAATIRLDAFPDVELKGKVTEVADYAASTGFLGPDVKEFETIINILDPEKDLPKGQNLRPGMTAEVKIRVGYHPGVLQVPVQAIIEHGGKLYCVLRNGDRFEKREVTIGANSDKFVVIQRGLDAGQKVVRNAVKYRDEVGLGEEAAEDESKDAADESKDAADRPSDRPQEESAQQKKPADGAGPRRFSPAEAFKKMDRNGNGRLEEDELPERMRSRFSDIDTNGDKAVSREELTAAMRRFMSRGAGAGRKPPGGGHPPGAGP